MVAKQYGAPEGEWRRSRSCVGDGHCLELSVANDGTEVRMRNSTAPETVLTFDATEWNKFVDAIRTGEIPLI